MNHSLLELQMKPAGNQKADKIQGGGHTVRRGADLFSSSELLAEANFKKT